LRERNVEREIVRLDDASEHVDRVTGWLLEQWPDPSSSFQSRRARLLDARDCPSALIVVSAGAPCGVVGFARFRRDGDERPSLFVDALYVHPSARAQGYGSALLEAAVAAAAAFAQRLFVYTTIAPWYQRRGWTVAYAGTAPGHFVLERSLAGLAER
jgi:GNAT superfamily N-acetyltransferase